MISLKKRNKSGFTYVVAIAMLGLLAFMGLFLIQSSSAEYSQTSLSLYKTMGRQLAEAAAEETVDLNSMKKAELAEFAAAKGIEVDSKLKKEEMIAAIEAALAK